jgi:hypothetical protein
VFVVQKVEHIDRFLVAVSLGERIGVFGEIGIRQDVAMSHETLTMAWRPKPAPVVRSVLFIL